MAGNTLVTRLMLETGQFDNNLRTSKKQIQNFDNNIKNIGASVGKAFGTIGLAIGVSGGAMEAFNRTIAASETLSDEYGRTMEGLRASVDSFFGSLSKGSFDGFFDGLRGVIRLARDAYDAIDNLGTFKTFQKVDLANNAEERAKQQMIIRDEKSTAAEKERAAKELIRLQGQRNDLLKKEQQLQMEAGRALVRSELAKQGFKGNLSNEEIDKLLSVTNQSESAKRYAAAQEIIKQGTSYTAVGGGGMFGGGTTITNYTKEAKDIIDSATYLLDKAFNEGEAGITKAADYYVNAANVGASLYNDQKTDNKYLGSINDTKKQAVTVKADKVDLIGDKFGNDAEDWGDEDVLERYKRNSNNLDLSGVYGDLLNPIETPEVDEINDSFSTAINGLGQFTGLLSAFGVAADDSTKKMLNAASAIFSMVGGILSFLPGGNIAGGILGGIGNLFGGAFATGGIVGGNSFTGDKVIARVNSGEMVLNHAQQGNLFKALNSGVTSGGGEVQFEIKGDKLVGVLNNYSSKKSKLR